MFQSYVTVYTENILKCWFNCLIQAILVIYVFLNDCDQLVPVTNNLQQGIQTWVTYWD